MPTVSIVIPTANRPELLKKAIESVLAQTYRDFEIIVVDDGGVSPAREVLSEYRKKENFVYLETQKAQGAPVARNMGIQKARGTYIAFLDDDDVWKPEKLSKQMDALVTTKDSLVKFSFCAIEQKFSDGRVNVTTVSSSSETVRSLALRRFNGFMTSSLVVHAETLREVEGFDETFPSHQEPELILRITEKYTGIGIDEPLVVMRGSDTDDHIGGNVSRRITGREMLLQKHASLFSRHPTVLAHHYFWLALQYREKQSHAESARYFKESFKLNPKLRTAAHTVRAYLKSFKHSVITKLFKPTHVGLLIRMMYFRHYISKIHFDRKDISILDAGCGRGRYSRYLATQHPEARITAVDIARQPEWEEHPVRNITFKEFDLSRYDETEERDLIVSIDVLEHIDNNRHIATKLVQGLRRGGCIYLAVPCDDTEVHVFPEKYFGDFHEWEEHEHIGEQMTLDGWIDLMKEDGLEVLLARHTFSFWGTFAWEVEHLFHRSRVGRMTNVLLMPVYRLFGLLDIYVPIPAHRGNNLIIARRPE